MVLKLHKQFDTPAMVTLLTVIEILVLFVIYKFLVSLRSLEIILLPSNGSI